MKQSAETSNDWARGVLPTSVRRREPLESDILYILIFLFALRSNSSSGGALVAGLMGSGEPNSSTILLGGGSFSSMMKTFASPPLMSSRIAHAAFTACQGNIYFNCIYSVGEENYDLYCFLLILPKLHVHSILNLI